MTAEHYADVYRRYQTYVRNYGDNKVYKVACGASDFNYHWTEVLMREAARYMDGLSLHYYTVPHTWADKGSATEFTEDDWFVTLQKALRMDELVTRHAEIMDRYDPEQRVGLMVDEWGVWHNVEPGTHPGFLYQQNTLRDALVAGVTLNILNQHCDRVQMANLAQTVNVLQALILTQDEQMLLTPTYHVYDMYQVHQDADLLETRVNDRSGYVHGGERLPQVSASASRDETGTVHVSLCNLAPQAAAWVELVFAGLDALGPVSGRMLTAGEMSADGMSAHNSFAQPDAVHPVGYDSFATTGPVLTAELAPMSVVVLEL
jgi:alpha-N-arabinofuranosidase